jgi:hypothetical protein
MELDYKVGMNTGELSRFYRQQVRSIDEDFASSLTSGRFNRVVSHTLPDAVRDSVAPSLVKDYFYAKIGLLDLKGSLAIFVYNFA